MLASVCVCLRMCVCGCVCVQGDVVATHRIPGAEVGEQLRLDDVLLVGSASKTLVGRPTVPNARVVAVVEELALDKKVIVFKKKRRKGYKKTQGFRRQLTILRITDVECDTL